jgi:hypothetical protein
MRNSHLLGVSKGAAIKLILGLAMVAGTLQATRNVPASPIPWEGYYCAGGGEIAMRVRLVSLSATSLVSVAAPAADTEPRRVEDKVVSRTPDSVETLSVNGRRQTLTRSGDTLKVTEGKVVMPMFRCDWLGDEGVYFRKYAALSLKNFGAPECRPFASRDAVFLYDIRNSHTGRLTQTLIGKGMEAITFCRTVPVAPERVRPAMLRAIAEAGLTLTATDTASGNFLTREAEHIQPGLGGFFARPFREQFAIAVTPDGTGRSRITITRHVAIMPTSDTGWMRMSSDGYKEHWLITNTLRLAALRAPG